MTMHVCRVLMDELSAGCVCFFSFLCVDDIDNEILSWNSEIFMWYLKIHPTLLRDAMLVRYMLALCVCLSVRLSIRMSVFHKLALYQNG